MRIVKALLVFLALIIFLLPGITRAEENNQVLKNSLKQCYDIYLIDYNKYAKETITAEDNDYNQDDINFLRSQFKKWAEARINLLACYEGLLAGRAELLSLVQGEKTKSEAFATDVDSFDFNKLIQKKPVIEPKIQISANSRKVFRLQTFCLDGGRSYPDAGEEFYLAGSTEILGRENLCSILEKARSEDNLDDIQGEVWGTEKFPKSSANTSSLSPTANIFNSNQNSKTIYLYIGVASIFALLIVTILSIILIRRFNSKGLKILSGVILGILIMAMLTVIGFCIWKYFKNNEPAVEIKTATPTPADSVNKNALIKAEKDGKISIFVVSTGSMKETDMIITNNSNKELEFDASCLYFLPVKTTAFGEETSRFLPFISKVYANPGMGSQKIGSAGSIGDGPPIPDKGPSPDDLMAEIKGEIEADLSAALNNFKNNPSEETLKKLLDALGNCQKIGSCQEDSAESEMINTWQKFLDEQINKYKSDESAENQEALLRATEVCQYLGCNSDEALKVLGL